MGFHIKSFLALLVVVSQIILSLSQNSHANKLPRILGPCQTCRLLVISFQTGLERTANASLKRARQNTINEPLPPSPQNLADVSNLSRFEDIMKYLCTEVKSGKDQCLDMAAKNSNALQDYWQEFQQNAPPDLLNWICIDKLKVCCKINHFGPHCTPCAGYPDDVCSGHGKCKGNGTRKGNGACICDIGYIGTSCDSCAKLYHEAYRDSNKLICSQCHRACAGGCFGPGPKNCDACNEGWESDEERGCLDINECLMLENSCGKNEFCVNTEGSYACFECDRSCDGCIADGPDMCNKCAPGYTLIEKLCIDQSSKIRDKKIDYARYATYFGLCISTCIIFQKNYIVASLIGVAVGVYIAASEYLLTEQSNF